MPVSSKEFLDIQATIQFGFNLKRARDMIRTCSHDFYSNLNMKDIKDLDYNHAIIRVNR